MLRSIWGSGCAPPQDPTDHDVLDFILEIALLSKLNHPNIMRFWRGCAEISGGRRSLLLVTEFVEKGGLSTLLHGHGGPRLEAELTSAQVRHALICTNECMLCSWRFRAGASPKV